jgi:DNA-binding NtrC family response regulator
MMTGFGSVDTAVDAMKAGAFEYISKPFKFDEIKLTLKRAIEQLQSEPERREGVRPDPTRPSR